MYLAERNTKFL